MQESQAVIHEYAVCVTFECEICNDKVESALKIHANNVDHAHSRAVEFTIKQHTDGYPACQCGGNYGPMYVTVYKYNPDRILTTEENSRLFNG